MLAVLLAVLVFAAAGRAEAAAPAHHDHAGHHGAVAAQHDPSPATAGHVTHPRDEMPGESRDGASHHGGGCHCVSAGCTPVLPTAASDHHLTLPRSRHDLPSGIDALALAGVDPPAKPPRS